MKTLTTLCTLLILTAAEAFAQTGKAPSLAALSTQPSMNVFRRFSVDAAKMTGFYGDVLGLKALPALRMPGGGSMILFQIGSGQVKLQATPAASEYPSGPVRDVSGLRVFTFFFPDEQALTARFVQHGYPKRATPKEILLDSDATDDPCHGQQEFAFFHGKYGEHMYHPLFFFEAKTGCLLSAMLRPGNASASAGIATELSRLVPILKRRFPQTQLSYRADAGSATPEIYRTLESFEMLYAIGIASNSVFKKRTARWLNRATRKYARTKTPIRLFYSFRHRARSWNKQRRIVVKIEVGPLGTNVRFVITNRPGRAEQIYDGYDERGECENRIKEFKRDLSADRLSCHSYRANAFRLQLHALAYQLLVLFRLHALRTTDLAHARLETLRLKLFKVGARFVQSARHLWFHLSSSWPGRDRFVEIWQNLKQLPQPVPG